MPDILTPKIKRHNCNRRVSIIARGFAPIKRNNYFYPNNPQKKGDNIFLNYVGAFKGLRRFDSSSEEFLNETRGDLPER